MKILFLILTLCGIARSEGVFIPTGTCSVSSESTLPSAGYPGECCAAQDLGVLYCWSVTNAAWEAQGGGGTGTVTSVGVHTDSTTSGIFANTTNAITGSPVTTSGNMTLTFKTQTANYILAGPTSGSAAAPTYRAMVSADLPAFLNTNSLGDSLAMVTDSSGNINTAASTTVTEIGYVHGVTSALQTQLNAKLPTTGVGLVEQLTGFITSPAALTYVLDQYASYAYTINTLNIQTTAGTATVEIEIGGTGVTGMTSVSVSSSNATATATGANSVSAGNQVTMVVTSPSSAANMSFTLKYTR